MRNSIALLLAAAAAMTVACSAAQDPEPEASTEGNVRQSSEALKSGSKTAGPLIDHGGAVLATSHTYAIYWGTPTDFPSDLETGMAALLGGFNGSSYLGIAQQYMRGAQVSTSFEGSFTDTSAPPKTAPSSSDLATEVCKLFPTPDPLGIYIVFTSNAPNVSYCAWHNKASCGGVTFEVAYVPNQAQLSGCSPYTKTNLNCNSYSVGTVASADSVAHEFMESITDPLISAWYDQNKQEVGDKCNFNYQHCVTLGGTSNVWQIQSEWSNAINGCQQ